MSERKTRLKNHIKAAREWLCKAEDSLDKDNNIQGDLNLMLAQAELQRANESAQGRRKKKINWIIRLAPAAAAILLVFAGTQFWPHVFATRAASPPLKTVSEEKIKAPGALPPVMSEINTGEVSTPPVDGQKNLLVEDKPSPSAAKEQPLQIPSVKEKNTVTEVTADRPIEPQVPTADMQKLMRAAGKTLRAQ